METPIPQEKDDTMPSSISSDNFQQREAIDAYKLNGSHLIDIYAIPQAEDTNTHCNMHCSSIPSLGERCLRIPPGPQKGLPSSAVVIGDGCEIRGVDHIFSAMQFPLIFFDHMFLTMISPLSFF